MEIDFKPILVAVVINLAIIYILPRLFSKPTGFKAFDDFVSYLKAQQAFLGFSTVLLAIVLYATEYYMKQEKGGETHHGDLLTEDFLTPSPKTITPD
jgi:hypothetical protein